MPNSISFDVQFSKQDILDILAPAEVGFLNVKGTYTYNSDTTNEWMMNAVAQAFPPIGEEAEANGCIQPCPKR